MFVCKIKQYFCKLLRSFILHVTTSLRIRGPSHALTPADWNVTHCESFIIIFLNCRQEFSGEINIFPSHSVLLVQHLLPTSHAALLLIICFQSTGCGNKKTPLRKMHYCRISASELSRQIFGLCSLNSLRL